MFPTVRLTVVAILAAIAGIGCGLGLFATFRVNHEPLARLAEGSPPLQLAFDKLGLDFQARAPLEARLSVNSAANLIPVPAIPTPPPDQAGVEAAISDASGNTQPAADGSADNAVVEQSGAPATAAIVPTEQQSNAAREENAAAPPQQEAVTAAADQEPVEPRNEADASGSAVSHSEQMAAIDAAAPVEQPDAPPSEPAALSPTPVTTEQTAAIDAVEKDQAPVAKPALSTEKKAAKPAARAPHPAAARRAAKGVRARRTITTATAQPAYQYPQTTYAQSTYTQPAYTQPAYTQPAYTQSTYTQLTSNRADGTVRASPAVKRVQVRRHRALKNTAAAAQSNSTAATAAVSGGQ